LQVKDFIYTDVPEDQVDALVEDLKAEGASKVTKERQSNGTWIVRASYEKSEKAEYT
jgi:hypothetical protein